MTGFSADWLELREPHDLRARNSAVLDAVVASQAGNRAIRIVDLACGTGSTLRALAPRFYAGQHWRLADNDLSLLARAAATARPSGVTVTAIPLDLNRDLEAARDGPIDLVTTSALLDLVSEPWLDRLAGFGPALGPRAASAAIARFQSLGCSVVRGTADWVVGPLDREFQLEIFAGWASAARDMPSVAQADTVEWLTFRRDEVDSGRSSLRVGHVDFFARPTGSR